MVLFPTSIQQTIFVLYDQLASLLVLIRSCRLWGEVLYAKFYAGLLVAGLIVERNAVYRYLSPVTHFP